MTTNNNHPDSRWICWQCGDLDHLDQDGLCRSCAPDRTWEWWQVIVRAICGEPRRVERAWRIQ